MTSSTAEEKGLLPFSRDLGSLGGSLTESSRVNNLMGRKTSAQASRDRQGERIKAPRLFRWPWSHSQNHHRCSFFFSLFKFRQSILSGAKKNYSILRKLFLFFCRGVRESARRASEKKKLSSLLTGENWLRIFRKCYPFPRESHPPFAYKYFLLRRPSRSPIEGCRVVLLLLTNPAGKA